MTQSYVESCPRPFTTALFNFTIDFELIWGNARLDGFGHTDEMRLFAARRQMENFEPFVRMLEDLRFPISWAVVGKLLRPDLAPPPDARFHPVWYSRDWYVHPEGADLTPAVGCGGPYLNYLKSCSVGHEILSHGFGHIDFGDPATTEAVADTDIRLSKELLTEAGIEVTGFAFPCNHVAHAELLPNHGFNIARGPDDHWHLSDTPVPMTPVGFCIDPGFYSPADIKQIIDDGINRTAFIHPWMHLVECNIKQRDIDGFYRPIFEYVLRQQERGRLANISFGGIRAELARIPAGNQQ